MNNAWENNDWEITIHKTAFEYLKFKHNYEAIHFLEKSSLSLHDNDDGFSSYGPSYYELYVKVPMNLKESYNGDIEEKITEAYDEALGSNAYLQDIYVEIKKIKNSDDYSFYSDGESIEIGPRYEYDIVLSFAGEDRNYVEEVANQLLYHKIKVFYDNFETVDIWGKNLYTHFDEIYRKKAKFCVIFISKSYANKVWTNHERESAQARSFQEREEYILPVRFDKTEIPGMRPTISYIDGNKYSPSQLASLIFKKVSINK